MKFDDRALKLFHNSFKYFIMNKRITILILAICLTIFQTVSAQQDTQKINTTVMVETKDGSKFIGKLIERTGSKITIETKSAGTLTLEIANLKSIVEADPTRIKSDGYWFENPHATRNLYGPTGFGLHKGEGYFNNTMIFLNQFSYGISDNISIGGGFEVLSLLAGQPPAILYLTPKVSFKGSEKYHVGVGALIGSFGFDGDRAGAGIVYVTNTFGSRDNNFTAGLGYGYAAGEWAKQPSISISGQFRMSRKWGFVTENYILKGVGIISANARRLSEDSAWDFGLLYPITSEGSPPFAIPFVGYTILFGKRRKV